MIKLNVIHIKSLKQALNYGLVLKNVHRAKIYMYIYIYIYIYDFEKDIFKLLNNAVFRKTMENVKKRDAKLVTTERRTNYLVSKPNHNSTKFFTEYLLAI